jgi:hypothetical protein
VNDYTTYTDGDLDAAYGAARQIGDMVTASAIANEIINRLSNFSAFVGGVFGQVRFPLYNGYQGTFQQAQAAQSSTIAAAGNLWNNTGGAVANAVGNAANTATNTINMAMVAVIIVGGIVVYYGIIKGK